jgi:hypothetical protein
MKGNMPGGVVSMLRRCSIRCFQKRPSSGRMGLTEVVRLLQRIDKEEHMHCDELGEMLMSK